ncbi:hypothetical protein M9H77_10970 [Catharanthus roseus]|uniref:Uncharacterized protein n=1 Tax=Catharanthus roseus TaxID=4058 RepID=A0ACC0BD74_CATRO|nr:hypothetical protein M9H77_10970 [Catharanthus roseus]
MRGLKVILDALQHKNILYYESKYFPHATECSKIEKFLSLLKPYPTSNLYFSNVRKIQQLIEKNLTNEDEVVKNMAIFISQKFKKYWDCYSIVLSFAIILDPRYATMKVKNVRDKLYSLFDEYMQFAPNPCLHIFDTREYEEEEISTNIQSWIARLHVDEDTS